MQSGLIPSGTAKKRQKIKWPILKQPKPQTLVQAQKKKHWIKRKNK